MTQIFLVRFHWPLLFYEKEPLCLCSTFFNHVWFPQANLWDSSHLLPLVVTCLHTCMHACTFTPSHMVRDPRKGINFRNTAKNKDNDIYFNIISIYSHTVNVGALIFGKIQLQSCGQRTFVSSNNMVKLMIT